MKKFIHLILILFISASITLTSCSKTLIIKNEGDSINVRTILEPIKFLYSDGFYRPDTKIGELGLPQVGVPYALFGRGLILGTIPTTRIKNHRWVSDDNKDVYAVQQFAAGTKINHAGVTFRWDANKGINGAGVFVILFSEMGGMNVAFNCDHIIISRVGIEVDVFENGQPSAVNFRPFDPYLELGKNYTFAFTINDNAILYTVDGIAQAPIVDGRYAGKVGRSVCFEHYYNTGFDENIISVREAWAGSTL